MQIEKAYLFGKQISGGIQPLPDNVYYDAGRFNTSIIPSGFDFENNIQRFPIGAMGAGETQIEYHGYFDQYVYTGAILACYGGGGVEFENTQEGIKHIYEKGNYSSNYFWTTYYLPLQKNIQQAGITKICFNVATSNVGDTGATYIDYRVGILYHDPAYDYSHDYVYMPDISTMPSDPNTSELLEKTVKVDFSSISNFQNCDFPYVFVRAMGAGTYIFRKIWFE